MCSAMLMRLASKVRELNGTARNMEISGVFLCKEKRMGRGKVQWVDEDDGREWSDAWGRALGEV